MPSGPAKTVRSRRMPIPLREATATATTIRRCKRSLWPPERIFAPAWIWARSPTFASPPPSRSFWESLFPQPRNLHLTKLCGNAQRSSIQLAAQLHSIARGTRPPLGAHTGASSRRRVDLGLPGKDWLTADPLSRDDATLCDLTPDFSQRCRRPVIHHIIRARNRHVSAPIREVGHNDDGVLACSSPSPGEDALAFIEVDVNEIGVVDREGGRRGAEFYKSADIPQDTGSPGVRGRQVIVDRVHLFGIVNVRSIQREVHRLCKLIAGKDHGDTHCSQQADESKPDGFVFECNAEAVEKAVEAVVVCAVSILVGKIMRANVVDRLGAIVKERPAIIAGQIAAVDHLTHRPLERGLVFAVAADDGIADAIAELVVPQSVDAGKQSGGFGQLFADGEEAGIGCGVVSRVALRLPARTKELPCFSAKAVDEIVVVDVIHAVQAVAVEVVEGHPPAHVS